MMYWDDRYGWNNGGGFLIGILCMITVVLVVWLVFSLVKRGSHPDHHLDLKETPRQILDRRFAAGEIDAAAYSQSRTLLEGKSS